MENYWRSYGFTHDPFSGQMQVSFIPKSWEDYLDLLPQFTRFCNTLLIITGADHIGKTSLVQVFLSRLAGEFETLFLTAGACQQINQLLQLFAEKYGAPYDAQSTLSISQQLDEQLNYLKANKQNRLLVIDDAQDLPVEVRQACLQIVQTQNALETCLPVILLGTPVVAEQFNALLTPTTASECLHVIEMTPLTEVETRDYLEYACRTASGRKFIFPFTEEDIAAIYTASQGLIGRINDTARDILMNKEQTQFNWRHLFRGKVAWWTITIVVIIILLFVYRALNQRQQATYTQPIPVQPTQSSPTSPPATQNPATPAQPAAPTNNDYQTGDTVVKNSDSASAVAAPAAPNEAMPDKSAVVAPAPTSMPQPIPENPVSASSSAKVMPDQSATPRQEKTKPAPKPKSKPLTASERQQYFDTVMTKKLAIQKQQVKQANPNFYAIQFLGAKDIHTAARFIADYQLQVTAKIVKIRSNNQDWYIVIYGQFPNQAAAKQGVTKLSPDLRKLKPWTRSYKSIQEVMK